MEISLELALSFLAKGKELFESDDWVLVHDESPSHTTKIYSRKNDFIKTDSSLPLYNGRCNSNLDIDSLLDWITSSDLTKLQILDPNIKSFRVVKAGVENGIKYSICHQTTTMPFPIYPRETKFVSYTFRDGDIVYLVGYSVPLVDSDTVTESNSVESKMNFSVHKLCKMPPNDKFKTSLSKIIHIEPGGYIPDWVVQNRISGLAERYNRIESLQ